jgi:hypothetical protein
MIDKMSFKYFFTLVFLNCAFVGFCGLTWTYAPGDTTINCGDSEHFLNTGQPSAATDCALGGVSITFDDVKVQSGVCLKDSVITRVWEVTDACGNFATYTQVITIVDTLAPGVTCPSSQVLQAADGTDEIILNYVPLATIDDPCTDYGDLVIVQTPSAGTNLAVGSHTINISATDLCGYSSDCNFTLHVYDTAGLYMLTFPSDTLVNCEHSLSSVLLGTGSAVSTCPVNTVSYVKVDNFIAGPCDGADTIVRFWTASDICGNSENYTQIITTYDTEAPFILCMISDTFCNSTNGINAFLGDYTMTTAELDNCSDETITQKPVPGAVINVGVITCWLYATDDCGNVDSCSMSVVVGDTSGLSVPENSWNTLALFPNPSDGHFTVQLPNVPGNISLRIIDVLGRELLRREDLTGGKTENFELMESSGVYLVEVTAGELRRTARLKIQ